MSNYPGEGAGPGTEGSLRVHAAGPGPNPNPSSSEKPAVSRPITAPANTGPPCACAPSPGSPCERTMRASAAVAAVVRLLVTVSFSKFTRK